MSTRGEWTNLQGIRSWNYLPKKRSRRKRYPTNYKLEQHYDSRGRGKKSWIKAENTTKRNWLELWGSWKNHCWSRKSNSKSQENCRIPNKSNQEKKESCQRKEFEMLSLKEYLNEIAS